MTQNTTAESFRTYLTLVTLNNGDKNTLHMLYTFICLPGLTSVRSARIYVRISGWVIANVPPLPVHTIEE